MVGYTPGGNISSQLGMPLYGISGVLPFQGNTFWVDQTNGSDGNDGGPNTPFRTLSQAHTQCTAGQNDVVLLTGTAHQTATLTWSKSKTHLIGLAGAIQTNSRARISNTGANIFTPLVNVTAEGCIFESIGAFQGMTDASAQICWQESGGRNYYSKCSFLGMGDATAAAQAGGRSLKISTNGENTFENCQIGVDTITSSAANASLEFSGATPRNTFKSCIFPRMTSSATTLMILITGSGAIDRWQWFQDCVFANNIKSTSTGMTAVASMTSASPGGMLVMQRCTSIGSTKWGDTNALANMFIDGGAPTAATSGLAVAPT